LGLLGLRGVFGFLSGPLLVAFAAFENGFWSGNLFCLGMKRKKKSARQSSSLFAATTASSLVEVLLVFSLFALLPPPREEKRIFYSRVRVCIPRPRL